MDSTTQLLPAERAAPEALKRQIDVAASLSVSAFFDDYPEPAVIINAFRQIVWTNAATRRLSGVEGGPSLPDPGKARPGEYWGCIHSRDDPAGCGAGPSCSFCSVSRCFRGMLEGTIDFGESGSLVFKECSMERLRAGLKETLEFELWMKPVKKEGETLVFVAFKDISQGRRRKALERIFFHDVLNTASGISTWLELSGGNPSMVESCVAHAQQSTKRLIEEIQSQRTLSHAEDGELEPEIFPVSVGSVLAETAAFCRAFSENREIAVHTRSTDPSLLVHTDQVLLRRVLANLIKNAIEASFRGQEVACEAKAEGNRVVFEVRNEGTLTAEQKARIFQRSYSTKGANRGLGTYGALLIVERYLSGGIAFESGPDAGTVFRVTLPLIHPLSPLFPKGE